ncbi:hypothetical protein GIB67_011944 [Kingdonia uniflora]|uniref:Uncharacterized protein n=1 Tax=Kingdonia uniflora TaxID=39325 RepID=A0A7J7LZX9_9MAGN|nr:hypothetical protein GIB67_011944 [Kingdonia uniflora]
MWKMEDAESPKVAGYYTKVAESKFMISVEEFFIRFCSDDAAKIIETFHERCGDKERSLTKLDGPTDIIQNDEVQPERHDKSSVVPETIHVPKNLNLQLECSSERGTGHENINGNGNNVRGRAKDVAWLEKWVYQLKDEMFIIEA